MTNQGLVELTSSTPGYNSTDVRLYSTTGTVVNESGGQIKSLSGSAGGGRGISAEVENQVGGVITIDRSTWISKAGASHINAGTINVTAGDPYEHRFPTWSSDDTQMAFWLTSGFPTADDGIHVMNADGTDMHLVRQGGKSPDWKR